MLDVQYRTREVGAAEVFHGMVHLLGAGHFALETHHRGIAGIIRRFPPARWAPPLP